MAFTRIDLKTWNRAEHFHHYMKVNPCTYSMTVKLDITRLRESNAKLYPAILYGITKIVNAHEEFRMALDEALHLNVKTMLENALYTTRIEMGQAEQKQFYDKYIRNMRVVIDDEGNASLELNQK